MALIGSLEEKATTPRVEGKPLPPGGEKILDALETLLEEKEYSAITWAEISRVAGVNEALISRYFGGTRNLLNELLRRHFEKYLGALDLHLRGIEEPLIKLRKLIWHTAYTYQQDRVYAKMIMFEVRNYPGYYESAAYEFGRHYGNTVLEIIEEGIERGDIRDDISPRHLRQIIIGSVEHVCMPYVVFAKEIDPDVVTESVCKILFEQITKP
jgi:AcrR family transcriptional regulator